MWNRLKNLFKPNLEPMNKIFIHSKNILSNYKYLQSLQPDAALFPVLKSNAYWHGLEIVTKILNKTNAPYIVVDSFPEYQIVKDNSKKNILLLGETLPKNYKKFDFSRTTFCVYNIETITYLAKLKKHINIHLFLDTWMHREWINEDELINILEYLKDFKKINIEWVLSHFYWADSITHNGMQNQIKAFKKMYHTIIDYGYNPQWKHIWSSAWLIKMKDDFFNAYRPGLSLYGYTTLSADDEYFKLTKELKPALSIVSKIISTHEIWAWEWVSYDLTWETEWPTKVASIPFGYFEWLPRSASNKISFKQKKEFVKQIWNICMNLCCVQLENGKIWDDIEIIWLEWENSMYNLAKQSDRLIYEVLVDLDRNIRRETI